MTLPSLLDRANEFNKFDVMANTNIDDAMLQVQSDESTVAQQRTTTQNSNNNNSSNVVLQFSPAGIGAHFTESLAQSNELTVEAIMPGIYFTKNLIVWNEESLRAHGFTHTIIIDKHIQELYYPSPVFKLASLCKNNELYDTTSPFDYFCNAPAPPKAALNFSKEFEAIDLNFGEKSYLTTVLPNCYRAVRFISKALQSGGTILVIDCNGGDQKCLTIVVAYLMFKYNINFKNAFERLKMFYNKADLDRFYVSQLYEYEPILQVQRAQSRGQSCSRELHAAILKRKKRSHDDECDKAFGEKSNSFSSMDATTTNAFLQNFNPLTRFNQTMAAQHAHQAQQIATPSSTSKEFQLKNAFLKKSQDFQANSETVNSCYHQIPTTTSTFDDYAME